jgi:hypothetical protein
MTVQGNGAGPTRVCCEDDQCAENSNNAYSCSSTYADKEYALQMCPQFQRTCGNTQEIIFDEMGADQNITLTGMTPGESCTFYVKSRTGSPGFRKTPDSTIDDRKMNMTFVEYNKKKVNVTSEVGTTSTDSPQADLPARNQTFINSGNQGKKLGQLKPKRKTKDGRIVPGQDMKAEKEFLKKKKEKKDRENNAGGNANGQGNGKGQGTQNAPWYRPFAEEELTPEEEGLKPEPEEGTMTNETEPTVGYGLPTKGTYNFTDGGYKTFGTEGQGDMTEGVKEPDEADDEDRGIILTLTAVGDQNTATLTLNVGNYDFLLEYTWDKAMGLKTATVTVLALVTFMY